MSRCSSLAGVRELATKNGPRSRGSVASGNPSALRLGNLFGCIPRRFLPDWLRGQARRALPLTSPLPIGSEASISIKGEGFARHPHPFGTRPGGLRSACGLRCRP